MDSFTNPINAVCFLAAVNVYVMTLTTLCTVTQAGVPGSGKSFKGRMACLQIYNEALNDTQLEDVHNCPVRKWS